MCGIVAWAGKTPKKFNKAKFDLVASYNEERGTDSCGVATDGFISLGVHNNKVYRDFIVNVKYEIPEIIPAVIGHTRKSTFGEHNEDNAHPFGFGEIEGGRFEFIGVHNGSLLNHKILAKKFNINSTEYITTNKKKNKVSKSREKIDSEILLECIYKNKNFKVLSSYLGAAALVFQDLNTPNIIYCWHGASKKYVNDNDGKIYEERPLYYYKETRNSIYISSMENSLEAIGGIKDETIFEFKHNVVYKITDGNIEKAELFPLSRKECHYMRSYGQDYENINPVNNNQTNAYKKTANYGLQIDFYNDEDFLKHQGCCNIDTSKKILALPFSQNIKDIDSVNNNLYSQKGIMISHNIYNEIKPETEYKTSCYFWKLRYWKDTSLLQGCYTFIENFGFYYLGKNIKTANDQFWFLTNKEFFQGDFCFVNQNLTKEDGAFIPFLQVGGEDEIIEPPLYYFYKGIRVLEVTDYIHCLEMEENKKTFTWENMTHCSAHPIIDIGYSQKSISTQGIKLKDRLVTDIICPLGSNRIYTIENGNCIKIEDKMIIDSDDKSKDKNDSKTKTVDTVDTIVELLEDFENDIQKNEASKNNIDNTRDYDLVEKTLEEIFKIPFGKFPLDIARLQKYSNLEKVNDAIIILETFLTDTRKLIEIEPKEQ